MPADDLNQIDQYICEVQMFINFLGSQISFSPKILLLPLQKIDS